MSDILNSNLYLIIPIVSYTIGIVSIISYIMLKKLIQFPLNIEDKAIQSIVSEYTHRLNTYDKAIAELRVKIDTMELRVMQHNTSYISPQIDTANMESHKQNTSTTSHHESQLEPSHNHISTVSNLATVTQPASNIPSRHPDSYNGTMDFILKILMEKPRTSREIQHSVGRTREHTSRLMKKLYDSKLVIRDSNNKPFKYSITDAGRTRLMGRHGITGRAVYAADADSTDSQLSAMT
jgi:predicted transcriptional regulator